MTDLPARVEGAPRLIDWTGERCVPWAPDAPVVYEHFHRYLFAAELVRGRAVLDLASGEGFGGALLATTALSVLGIDVDSETVEHARANYVSDNLAFELGDARALSSRQPAEFGAVVAFEMIEHLAEQDAVLAGIKHVLEPDGLLVISTPERRLYSEATGFENPYHVRELTQEELLALLSEHFAHVELWGQRLVSGSSMWPLDREEQQRDAQRFVFQRAEDGWKMGAEAIPKYVIAVASDAELPPTPASSVLIDPTLELLRGAELGRERAEAGIANLNAHLAAARDDAARAYELLGGERRMNEELQARAAADMRQIGDLQEQLVLAQRFRTGVEGSVTWQFLQAVRRVLYGVLGGRRSPVGRLVGAVLRAVGRPLLRRR